MMKKVSFSQLKSNLVGRRHSTDTESNKKSAINNQSLDCSNVDHENSVAKEVSLLGKKDIQRSNNLFRVLKCKWKNKRGPKFTSDAQEESIEGASALPADGQDLFVPKKLRSKVSKSSIAKSVVCPIPSQIQCIPLTQDSDDTYENANDMGAILVNSGAISASNKVDITEENCHDLPAIEASDTAEGARVILSSQQDLPENESEGVVGGSGGDEVGTLNSLSASTSQRAGSLTKELFKLSRCGWYWGPITRSEAEEKLTDQPDGAFLVRDSSDDRYLLSLSFRSCSNTLHTRIEHSNGLFSFYAVQHQPHFANPGAGSSSNPSSQDSEGHSSIVALIEESMNYSQSGVFCYSRGRTPDSPSYPVRLTKPVSRFNQVRTLQYLCRFVIRQHTRVDHIQKLPLPLKIKGYLEESHY